MEQNQDFEYTEYKEETNYIQSIIFAFVGGLLGVGVWLAPIYFFEYLLYITVILVGIFAGLGARGYSRKKGNIALAIIAVVATVICIIIGDIAETALVFGSFDISLKSYLEYASLKFGEDPKQLLYYLGSIIAAGYFGYATLNQS